MKALYCCQCCGFPRAFHFPTGTRPPDKMRGVCPICEGLSCGGGVKTWLPANPDNRQNQGDDATIKYVYTWKCPECGDTGEITCNPGETPVLPTCKKCRSLHMHCDKCGTDTTVRGRDGKTPWLPACPACGTPAVLPNNHPDLEALKAAQERFTYIRNLVRAGRFSEECEGYDGCGDGWSFR